MNELDIKVMEAEGLEYSIENGTPVTGRTIWDEDGLGWADLYSPSTNWVQGGPIIEKHKICVSTDEHGWWMAWIYDGLEMIFIEHDDTPLTAAMRCYVASKGELK